MSDRRGLAGDWRPLVQDLVRTVVTMGVLARMGTEVGMLVPMWIVAMMVVIMRARLVVVAMIVWFSDGVICIQQVMCVGIIRLI